MMNFYKIIIRNLIFGKNQNKEFNTFNKDEILKSKGEILIKINNSRIIIIMVYSNRNMRMIISSKINGLKFYKNFFYNL